VNLDLVVAAPVPAVRLTVGRAIDLLRWLPVLADRAGVTVPPAALEVHKRMAAVYGAAGMTR